MGLYIETSEAKIVLPHPFQIILLLSTKRENAFVTGQGAGKTSFAPVLICDHMYRDNGDVIFTEPTYDMIERLAIPAFLDFIKGTEMEGDWISKKHHIYGTDYGKVYFLSTDVPEHLQGSHVKTVVMDEAGLSPYIAYQMLKNRTNLYNGQIFAFSNPYRRGEPWLFSNIYKRYREGDPEVLFLTSPSIWNPAFDKKRFEKDKQIMRPEDFAFYYLGIYTRPEGLVFPYEYSEVVKDVPFEGKSKVYAGADFGTGDPTVLEIAFMNTTGLHFIDEYYKQDAEISVHAEMFGKYIQKYNISEIYYDPSGLSYVKEIDKQLKEKGITVKWIRGHNDQRQGVEEVVGLIRQGRLTISPKCYRMLDEDSRYIWKNGNLPEKDDHTITARKYLVLGLVDKLKREYKQDSRIEKKIDEQEDNYITEHFRKIYEIFNKKYQNRLNDEINWLEVK